MKFKNQILFLVIAGITIFSCTKKEESTTMGEYMDDIKQQLFNNMISGRFEELKNTANPPFIFGFGGYNGGWARGWENFQLYAICGTDKIKEATEALIKESLKIKKFGFVFSNSFSPTVEDEILISSMYTLLLTKLDLY